MCFSFLLVYLVISNIMTLLLYGTWYNPFTRATQLTLLERIIKSYIVFLYPEFNPTGNVFLFNTKILHYCLIVLGLFITTMYLHKIYNEDKLKFIEVLLVIIMIPLAAYFIYCMVDYVHTVMTFANAFTLFLFVYLFDNYVLGKGFLKSNVKYVSYIILVLIMLSFVRISNICYTKATIVQENAISFYTTLITKIKCIDNYDDNLPVVYINEFQKEDITFHGIWAFEDINITPFHYDSIINSYTWEKTMKIWCGFDPIKGNAEDFIDNEVVKNMTRYPKDGSIKIVDNTIVVKFAD